MEDTNATTDSTQLDDSVATGESRTEEAMLADILRNTEFLSDEESLPNEQVPQLDAEYSDDEDPEESDEADNVDDEEEIEEDEVEAEDADDTSTQEADVYTTDDLDLDASVLVKIDGEEVAVSFNDLIKGYSTEQHLSNKGRELGEARKVMEEEYQGKIQEINSMAQASAAVLYSQEQELAKEYHEIEAAIEQARADGDTYEVNELKDKREQSQKQYWEARKKRETLVQTVQKQEEEKLNQQWSQQLEYFNETIPTLIPDFSEDTAMAIREFALKEGIPAEVLDTIADPVIVKFVDDYRQLKQKTSSGSAKRKRVNKAKGVPSKRKATKAQRAKRESGARRDQVLSGEGNDADQLEFLKSLSKFR